MNKERTRYSQMERRMTYALVTALTLFIVFLFASGFGTLWLQILTGIVATLICILCFVYLFLTKEWLRSRSLWMSVASIAIVLCILFSVILHFPAPL